MYYSVDPKKGQEAPKCGSDLDITSYLHDSNHSIKARLTLSVNSWGPFKLRNAHEGAQEILITWPRWPLAQHLRSL